MQFFSFPNNKISIEKHLYEASIFNPVFRFKADIQNPPASQKW